MNDRLQALADLASALERITQFGIGDMEQQTPEQAAGLVDAINRGIASLRFSIRIPGMIIRLTDSGPEVEIFRVEQDVQPIN